MLILFTIAGIAIWAAQMCMRLNRIEQHLVRRGRCMREVSVLIQQASSSVALKGICYLGCAMALHVGFSYAHHLCELIATGVTVFVVLCVSVTLITGAVLVPAFALLWIVKCLAGKNSSSQKLSQAAQEQIRAT